MSSLFLQVISSSGTDLKGHLVSGYTTRHASIGGQGLLLCVVRMQWSTGVEHRPRATIQIQDKYYDMFLIPNCFGDFMKDRLEV